MARRRRQREDGRGQIVLLLGLLALGAALRFAFLGTYPVGLNQDEASIGYEAWSLLHYGVDRNGNAWPVLLTAWGSGQNALYAYLSIPVVAVFGLTAFSVRFVSALLGTLTLPVMYLLVARLRGRRAGLLALAVLATNPWHIGISRWALESNILPFFLLLGIYLLVVGLERPLALTGAGIAFALCLYAYGTAFLILPLLLLPAAVYVVRSGKWRPRHLVSAGAVFAVLALPLALCQLRNAMGLEEMRIFGLTLPALLEGRQGATVSFAPADLLANFRSFWRLLYSQWDGLTHSGIPGWLLLPGGMLLAAAGLVKCLLDLLRREAPKGEALVLFAFLASVLAACFIRVNVNRINAVFLPILYFSGLGLWWGVEGLFRLSDRLWLPAGMTAVWMTAGLTIFCLTYFGSYQEDLSAPFHEGLGEAILYADALDAETVQVTDQVNMPYIYVLFYLQVPPGDYLDTVVFGAQSGGFQHVSGFGRYTFGDGAPGPDTVWITTPDRVEGENILAEFGNYVVVTG